MGYTHYFTQKKDCPPEQWAAFKEAVMHLYDHIPETRESAGCIETGPLVLCDGNGEVALNSAAELFGEEALWFNGDDREGRGLAHETMVLEQAGYGFAFCKTARKPYDWFVVAVLLLANHHCPGVWEISSDGDPEDWEPVRAWLDDEYGLLKLPKGINREEENDD